MIYWSQLILMVPYNIICKKTHVMSFCGKYQQHLVCLCQLLLHACLFCIILRLAHIRVYKIVHVYTYIHILCCMMVCPGTQFYPSSTTCLEGSAREMRMASAVLNWATGSSLWSYAKLQPLPNSSRALIFLFQFRSSMIWLVFAVW